MGWIVVSVLLLIGAVGTIGLRLGNQTKSDRYGGTSTVFGIGRKGFPVFTVGLVALWMLLTGIMSTNTIPVGHIGLVKTFSEITGQQNNGFHFKAPWQAVEVVDGRVQQAKVEMNGGKNGSAVSSETQPVYAELTINYRIQLDKAKGLYTDVGANYYGNIIEPRVQQAFKSITVKYKTEEVAPNREKIRNEAKQILTEQLDDFGITVNDLLIKNLSFSKEFEDAIERKQVATQDAKAAQEKVAQVKAEAAQKVEQAQGEAQAARINGQALQKNPLYLEQLAIEKLNPNVQVIMVPTDGENMILPGSIFGNK